MSKIEVPKELQEKIIHLYVEEKYGRMKIKKELNLPFGDDVIKRILKENHIRIRGYEEAKGGRKKIEVPKDLEQEIIKLYQEGYGLEKITEILKTTFSFDKVRSILKDNNIHIRTVQESADVKIMPDLRKYKVNDNYNLLSHNGCWMLGFYSADGYFPPKKGSKNKICLGLSLTDEEILLKIKEELKSEKPLCYYDQRIGDKVYPSVSLDLTSAQLRKEFEKYIPVINKTQELKHLPPIPEEYMIDYLRGLWDGDGSFCITYPDNHRVRFDAQLVSYNKEFLEEIAKYLSEKHGFSLKEVHPNHNIWELRYGAKEEVLKLGKLFYDNDYFALKRKKEKYHKMVEINENKK